MTKPTFSHRTPTATANQYRMQIFQATRRPVNGESLIVTSWGKIRVKGKLGQAHADLLDALRYCAEIKAKSDSGRIKLLVDPAQARKYAGITSGTQLRKLLDDLMGAVVEIYEPTRLACVGHLVDHVDKAVRSDGTEIVRANPLGGERNLWRVELGKALCKLIDADVWLGYNPAPLARLEHGVSQAVARHVLSHRIQPQGGWGLDGLILSVLGGEPDRQTKKDRRRELRQDAPKLANIGIRIDGERVYMVEGGGANA